MQRLSRMPTLDVTTLGVTTDASQMFGKSAPGSSGAGGEVEKGRNEIVSALFHANFVFSKNCFQVSSQAVTGRLACLSVARPAFVIFKVMPRPV